MVNIPSTPEIITVNSESLQTQIRDLLPSQNGFGSELQATNVITPIIALTAAAEGSFLPQTLHESFAFGSQTEFNVFNTTTTLINSPGFYRVVGTLTINANNASCVGAFNMTDGSTTKTVCAQQSQSVGVAQNTVVPFDLRFFLRAGDSLIGFSSTTGTFLYGSFRQVADGAGALVQPNGFPL